MTDKIPICNVCHKECQSWAELANHIWENRKTHRKGKVWAAHFLADVKTRPEIKRIPKDPDYKPTAFGDMNREIATKELSGKTRRLYTVCPQCKKQGDNDIPVEISKNIWNDNGKVFVLCKGCRRE